MTWLRDEFGSPEFSDDFKILNLLPHLSLAGWLAAWGALLLVVLFEGSFRLHTSLAETLSNKLGDLERIKASFRSPEDTLLRDAIYFVAKNDWPTGDFSFLERVSDPYSGKQSEILAPIFKDSLDRILIAARTGRVKIWGIPVGGGTMAYLEIPPEFWDAEQIDMPSLYVGSENINTSIFDRQGSMSDHMHLDLRMNRVQVEQAFGS